MRQRHLDRLFARFRSRGDARALAKVFDATAPELYRVATHLTKDLHAAEDLVQSTFLAAIEARESWDESRSLLPWLIGILARQAAYERRRRSRIIEPERLEEREAPEPAKALEAQELSDELARAIDGIPALYREVLIAHLKQGKTPQEIARELGRAPGTVRVQLHRALEMVRKTLPAGLATGAMVAALSPRGLSAIRAIVLRAAMRASVPVAAAAVVPPTAAAIGGLVMSSKAVFAVTGVVLCLAFVGRLSLHRSDSQRMDGSAAAPSGTGVAHAASGEAETASAELLTAPEANHRAPAISGIASPSPKAPAQVGGTQVAGHLLMPDGSPAVGAFVALVRMRAGHPGDVVQEETTANDGAFVLGSTPGPYCVVGLHERFLPLVRQVALVQDDVLHLDPAAFSEGAHIRGRVKILGASAPSDCLVTAQWAADGSPIRIHDQELVWSEGALQVSSRSSRTDGSGRIAIEGLEPRVHRVYVESTPERRILHATVFDVSAPTDDAELDVHGTRLVLHVLSGHQPLEARVTLSDGGHGGGNVWGFGNQSSVDVLVPSGAFFVADVEKEGYATASIDLQIPADDGTIEKDIELAPRTDLGELAFELVTSDGREIQQAGFGLFGTSAPNWRFGWGRRGSDGKEPNLIRDVKAEAGLFRLHDIPPGHYRIEVMAGGTWDRGVGYWRSEPIEIDLGPGASEQRRIEIRMGGRLRIRCLDSKGEALAARCKLFDAGGVEIPLVFFTRDERGSTWQGEGSLNASAPRGANEAFPSLSPGPYELRVSLDGYREVSQMVTVEAGTVRDVTIILRDG